MDNGELAVSNSESTVYIVNGEDSEIERTTEAPMYGSSYAEYKCDTNFVHYNGSIIRWCEPVYDDGCELTGAKWANDTIDCQGDVILHSLPISVTLWFDLIYFILK